jgi:hypothetical protein
MLPTTGNRIETHALNFPDAHHAIVNISQLNPRYFRTTGLLWASPVEKNVLTIIFV